jgi:hypothetical protein
LHILHILHISQALLLLGIARRWQPLQCSALASAFSHPHQVGRVSEATPSQYEECDKMKKKRRLIIIKNKQKSELFSTNMNG